MANGVHDVRITLVTDHWEVFINDVFFCSADSYAEAVNELWEVYSK